jgi:hypothetical protein
LSELGGENPAFKETLKIRLVGQTDSTIIHELGQLGLSGQLEITPHLNHKAGLKLLGQSAVLLLPLNDAPNAKGILPGKMYEYLALGRPILAMGPLGSDCEKIIVQTKAGYYCDFGDKEGLKISVERMFTDWQKGKFTKNVLNIEVFSRRNLAREIMRLGTSG